MSTSLTGIRVRSAALPIIAVIAVACGGCGQRRTVGPSSGPAVAVAVAPHAHPQAIEPLAGQAPQTIVDGGPGQVSVGSSGGGLQSRCRTRWSSRARAERPRRQPNQATLTRDGLAIPPLGALPAVQQVIQAGNGIAHLPDRYGGGHVTYQDTAYDCSGSISYVFQAAHLLSGSVVSGQLMNWGDPGPGKWITVFANAGHTFIYIAGLRFDTVALAETGDRWSARLAGESDLSTFAVRHPPGL